MAKAARAKPMFHNVSPFMSQNYFNSLTVLCSEILSGLLLPQYWAGQRKEWLDVSAHLVSICKFMNAILKKKYLLKVIADEFYHDTPRKC